MLTGCASINRALFDEREEVTEHVAKVPAATNEIVRGNEVLQIVTPESTVTNRTTNVVFSVRPQIASGISLAKSANELANPTPFAPLVNLALGGLATVLGYVARVKSKQAELVPTLIEGIETARENAPAVKAAVQRIAVQRGQNDRLHALVKGLTP